MEQSTSKIDAAILRAIARRGRTFVRLPEDRDWLSELTPNPALQLDRMADRGSIARIARGRYVVLPAGATSLAQAVTLPTILAAALSEDHDYYLGYLSALVEHRLTDELSDAIYIAVRGRTAPKLTHLAGRRVHITKIVSGAKWFGVERERAVGRAFYYRSDLERTLLDCLDRPALCGRSETWVRSWSRAVAQDRVRKDRLIEYARQWGGVVAARCAYWLRELGQVRESRSVLASVGAPLSGPRLLDPSSPFGAGPWPRDRETGLILNIPDSAVTGWLEYGK